MQSIGKWNLKKRKTTKLGQEENGGKKRPKLNEGENNSMIYCFCSNLIIKLKIMSLLYLMTLFLSFSLSLCISLSFLYMVPSHSIYILSTSLICSVSFFFFFQNLHSLRWKAKYPHCKTRHF